MKNDLPVDIENNALRVSAGLLIAFALAFFAYYSVNTISAPMFAIDFSPYYVAGQLLAYDNAQELIPQPSEGMFTTSSKPFLDEFRLHYFPDSPVATGWIYPAGYAWLFRPFANMDFSAAARWWLAVNMLLSCASITLVVLARPWHGNSRYGFWRIAWIIFIGLTFQPILDNLWHGNISVVILFCFCLCYLLLRRRRPGLAGFVLGLIVPLKLTPVLFILYFLWRRNWRFVIGALVGAFLIILVTWFTVGLNGLLGFANMILAQLQAGGVAAFNNQSISGFLLHALTKGDVNGWETINVPLWVTIVRYLLVLLLVGAVVWVMRRRPEKLRSPVVAEDLDLGLLIGVMLLASPITWYHYYVWMLLPLVIVFDYLLTHATPRRRLILFAVAYGLLAIQGFSQVRAFDQQAIQEVWLLRVLLSSSFFGAALFIGLNLCLREETR
jgi:hypothetical protein